MTRTLHAALMPFPSPQGTQGAVGAMVRSLRDRGDDVALFVHPHGDGTACDLPLVRSPRATFGSSLRSGPTLGRAALDALAIPSLARASKDAVLFAHNVEAATAARLIRAPYAFVAHTLMSRELPYYARRGAAVLSGLGDALDHLAASRADVVAAISPKLVQDLEARFAREVTDLPLPWRPVAEPSTDTRRDARARLGIADGTLVIGYTGNLDRYQGIELLLPTLAAVRAHMPAMLVVATESAADALREDARHAGLGDALVVRPLSGEADRAEMHALLDVLLVPRTCEGGVPIKLLDALSRGIAVVASHEATAGLPFGAAVLAARAVPESLAAACRLASSPDTRRAFATAGRVYLETHHGLAGFLAAHDRVSARLRKARIHP